MRYCDGTEVQEGDEVSIERKGGPALGLVVKIFIAGTPEAVAWSAPGGGVLIEGAGLGLSLIERPDADRELKFVRRRSAG